MFYLKTNVPGWERLLRIGTGIAVAILAFMFAQAPVGMWIGIGGGLMFAMTGLIGFCPMCAMVGRRPVELGK
jgi:hypothetical protein